MLTKQKQRLRCVPHPSSCSRLAAITRAVPSVAHPELLRMCVDTNCLVTQAKKIEDKTFGMKNKNKSKQVQQQIAMMKKTAGVDSGQRVKLLQN